MRLQIPSSLAHSLLQVFLRREQKAAAERSHCVCRRAEKRCVTGPARIWPLAQTGDRELEIKMATPIL